MLVEVNKYQAVKHLNRKTLQTMLAIVDIGEFPGMLKAPIEIVYPTVIRTGEG